MKYRIFVLNGDDCLELAEDFLTPTGYESIEDAVAAIKKKGLPLGEYYIVPFYKAYSI